MKMCVLQRVCFVDGAGPQSIEGVGGGGVELFTNFDLKRIDSGSWVRSIGALKS